MEASSQASEVFPLYVMRKKFSKIYSQFLLGRLKDKDHISTFSGVLPTSIQVFFEEEMKLTSDSGGETIVCKASEMSQLSFEYTCQLTALFGAEKAGTLANKRSIHETDNLVIHVVGAREAETKDVTRWEIFHSHLPNLKALTVVFIGPELR